MKLINLFCSYLKTSFYAPFTGYIILLVVALTLFALTIRGDFGTPTIAEIESLHRTNKGVFESSQESSRYGMIISMYQYQDISLDKFPYLGTPDLGLYRGRYYSFFPPTLSFLAIPLYTIGLQLGSAQLWTFLLIPIFSILTMLMIVIFSRKLSLPWSIAIFSAITFGFATNAWGYSVTLYAHVVSAFILLSAIFILTRQNKFVFLRYAFFWFLYGFAIYLDYPNLITFSPLAIYAVISMINMVKQNNKYQITLRWTHLLSVGVIIAMIAGLGFYNYTLFGNPLQISNSLPRVTDAITLQIEKPQSADKTLPTLATRNLLEGMYSFTISPDRGLLFFSPILLLFITGIGFLKEKRLTVQTLFLLVIITNFLQYSMFGDPYGGWAFGSRYMIVVMPLMSILVGLGLYRYSKDLIIKILFSVIFIYSASISLLAPLTTNILPPFVEARNKGLEYTYLLNIRLLLDNQLKSFIYNNYLNIYLTGWQYYLLVLSIIVTFGLSLIWWKRKQNEND